MVPSVGHPDLSPAARARRPILLNARASTRATHHRRRALGGGADTAPERAGARSVLPPSRRPARPRPRRSARPGNSSCCPQQAARRRASLIFSPANLAPVLWPAQRADPPRRRGLARAHRLLEDLHERGTGALVCCARDGALRVVTVSEFSRRELIELAGLDHDKLVVIRGGVGERFTPERRP